MPLELPPKSIHGWVDAISQPKSAILCLAQLYDRHAQRAQKSLERAIASVETEISRTLEITLPRPKFLAEVSSPQVASGHSSKPLPPSR